MFKFLKKKPKDPTPQVEPPPYPVPVATPKVEQPPVPDEPIRSQMYWRRRRQFLNSMSVWINQELNHAATQERNSNEPPSAPQSRRK